MALPQSFALCQVKQTTLKKKKSLSLYLSISLAVRKTEQLEISLSLSLCSCSFNVKTISSIAKEQDVYTKNLPMSEFINQKIMCSIFVIAPFHTLFSTLRFSILFFSLCSLFHLRTTPLLRFFEEPRTKNQEPRIKNQ